MGQPAARLTDMHVCPMVTPGTPPIPHVGGPILPPCEVTVLTVGLPQARVGDMALCVGPPDTIALGSFTVIVGGKPAARMGDMCAHGGTIVMGAPTVLIGDAGGGGGGGGGGGAGVPGMTRQGMHETIKPAQGTDIAAAQVAANYNNAIKIEGDAAFQAQVKADLDAIAATPSGKKLLDDLDKSGKTITIKKTAGGNSVNGFTGDAMVKDGKPGAGSNSTVNYNPDRTSLGTADWETRPPAIGLAHELVHAQHASAGTIDTKREDNDHKPDPSDPTKTAQEMKEEVRTVGIPPHDAEPYSENRIRDEWTPKQPPRPYY